jgi:hypothetical protein
MSSYEALHLEPDEEVILEVRKHWIVFIGQIVSFGLLALLPIFAYIFIDTYFSQDMPQQVVHAFGQYFHVMLFFYVLWILFLWIGFFLSWTKYYLDVWYVTKSRIIDIEQERIFYRSISNIRFDRIQDITVEVKGFLATMLNYGAVRVQTASENEADFFMTAVKNPDEVKRIIFAQHNFVKNEQV